MRGWLMLAGAIVILVVLPIVTLTEVFGSAVKLIGKIVLGILAVLALVGTGLFGYICFKAQARKWGTALFAIAVLCLIAIYWLITERLPFL